MFRVTTNTPEGSSAAPIQKQTQTSLGHISGNESRWPALRRITKGIFPERELLPGRIRSPGHYDSYYNASPPPQTPEDQSSQPVDAAGTTQHHTFVVREGPGGPRQKPKGPRELHGTGKGFNKFIQSLSRPKPPKFEDEDLKLDKGNYPSQGKDRAALDGSNGLGKSEFTHSTSDITRHDQQRRLQSRSNARNGRSSFSTSRIQTAKPNAAYVPTHAAADFSRLNAMPRVNPRHPLVRRYTREQTPSAEPASIRPIPHEAPPESTEYHNFLEQSKKEATRNRVSRWNRQRCSDISNVMNDITQRNPSIRQRPRSTARQSTANSTASRSRPPSLVIKVSEYIRPSRPGSVVSQSSGYASMYEDRGSVRNSVLTGQESWDNRWSRMSGSLRRSFSMERNQAGDEHAARCCVGRDAENWKRAKLMPVSPGLKKYNRSVAAYH